MTELRRALADVSVRGFMLRREVEQALFDLGSDQQPDVITDQQKAGAAEAAEVAVPLFYCPTRRVGMPYEHPRGGEPGAGLAAYNAYDTAIVGKTDYAANGGDTVVMWGEGPTPDDGFAGQGFADMSGSNGIVYQRSQVKIASIPDGTSNTYLLGERSHNPRAAGQPQGSAGGGRVLSERC